MFIIAAVLNIAYDVAILFFLFYFIKGVFIWITSNGKQDAIGHILKTILITFLGFVIIALSYMLLEVVGRIYSIHLVGYFIIPDLTSTKTILEP